MSENKVTVIKVTDYEYEGTCTACGKESVRWIVSLSDGSHVGGECAKKILGWAPTAKGFSWVTGMTAIVEEIIEGQSIVVWADESNTSGVISVNGQPQQSGSMEWVRSEYASRYAIYK